MCVWTGNYVVISSDASCIEFDILRFISERASYGDADPGCPGDYVVPGGGAGGSAFG